MSNNFKLPKNFNLKIASVAAFAAALVVYFLMYY
jgi:hypothetical protein